MVDDLWIWRLWRGPRPWDLGAPGPGANRLRVPYLGQGTDPGAVYFGQILAERLANRHARSNRRRHGKYAPFTRIDED